MKPPLHKQGSLPSGRIFLGLAFLPMREGGSNIKQCSPMVRCPDLRGGVQILAVLLISCVAT